MAADDSPQVVLKSPQTDSAIKLSDPSIVDDAATFSYATSLNFTISGYHTFTQDVITPELPQAFNTPQFAPTSSPFILQVDGSGFTIPIANEPFKIYGVIDGY